jgi:hypothetical protein
MVARSGKGWKLAAALITLEDQVNAKYPGRSKESDGSIGDLAHASRASDHNVRNGYCHAIDLTHDPRNGFSSEKLAQALLDAQDPRLSYVISNKKIGSGPAGTSPGKWRPYAGKNPHDHHCHVSVNALGEADARAWNIGDQPIVLKSTAPAVKPVLRKTMRGADVMNLKGLLKIKGIIVSQATDLFDNETFLGVQLFQSRNGLHDDGVVGPQTWRMLSA